MKLTQHFTLEELTRSNKATQLGISNIPSPEHLQNLKQLAATLENVRALLGVPIIISSGYRCPALNKAVGGAATSDHSNGLAADFSAPKFGSAETICRAIEKSCIRFDQLIFEQTWVHLGIGSRMRQQVFSMGKGKRANGIVQL